MRRLFFIIFLLIPCITFAREGTSRVVLHGGAGACTVEANAWSGSDLGNYLGGDPTLFNDAEAEADSAVNFGGDFIYFISNVALTTGLMYERKDFIITYPKNTASTDLKYEISSKFLTVPLGLRYYFEIFYLGGGIYYGRALDDADVTATAVTTAEFELEIDDDFGIFFDFGANYLFTETIGIDVYLRYEHGISEIYSENDLITDIKTRTLFINVGVSINL